MSNSNFFREPEQFNPPPQIVFGGRRPVARWIRGLGWIALALFLAGLVVAVVCLVHV